MTQASFRVVSFKLEFGDYKVLYEEYSREFNQYWMSNIYFNLRTPPSPKIPQLHFYP